MLYPNEQRAREVGISLGDRYLVETFVKVDPQFNSVKSILGKMGFHEGALYVVGVSLVSYMLSLRGEVHWSLAAELSSKPYHQSLKRFVQESPSLVRLREQRLRRLEIYLSRVAPILRRELDKDVVDLTKVLKVLESQLSTSPGSKTVAFATKMLMYALIAEGKKFSGGEGVPIPVDYRVSLVTLTSGMLEGWVCGDDIRKLAHDVRARWRSTVVKLWEAASRAAGTPPILLDSVVWVCGLCIDENVEKPSGIGECITSSFRLDPSLVGKLEVLWSNLIRCSHASP